MSSPYTSMSPQENNPNPQIPKEIDQPIVSNQVLPSNVQNQVNLNIILKTNPQFITCPQCGYSGITRTVNNFNIVNCLCCWFTDPICWLLFQVCRGKDISCFDATHFCASCNVLLGNYSAW